MQSRKLKLFAAGLILISASGAAGWYGLQKTVIADGTVQSGTAQLPQAASVEVAKVETIKLDKTWTTVGTLKAKESVTLASEIAGRIATISFEEGQAVKAGDILIALDTSVLDAAVKTAQAAYDLARITFERADSLSKRGISATQTRDDAEAALRSSEAGLALAKAQRDQAFIKAPFGGVVGLRSVSVGSYITAGIGTTTGTGLARLEQIDPLVVEFTLPEIAMPNVAPRQLVKIVTDALPNMTFDGAVYAIEPSIDEASRSIRLRALLDNADLKLRPGLFARVDVTVGSNPNALVIPESAIVPDGQKQTVFRLKSNDTVEVVEVSLGQRLGGKVEIVNGLAIDDIVVSAGQLRLASGTTVSITNNHTAGEI
ncbi:efflux RND transporter periplasmic adaptor subunit [Phyllobacterium sp.]|uniref:efflux RND transporter periplasmic adaptor subunit n=1 Tax=unclassified Phyllobacterium TaxID=2638441 RepID=UPI0031FCD577|nr:efflux RND transporter periplasmic adaptor subunit [Phyllobacterium sp.]